MKNIQCRKERRKREGRKRTIRNMRKKERKATEREREPLLSHGDLSKLLLSDSFILKFYFEK
jgi:hypothetical protein